ncbi:MAG TPA: hypothetical protein VIH90_03960 [Candidatus Saccharimonadales bacterium]
MPPISPIQEKQLGTGSLSRINEFATGELSFPTHIERAEFGRITLVDIEYSSAGQPISEVRTNADGVVVETAHYEHEYRNDPDDEWKITRAAFYASEDRLLASRVFSYENGLLIDVVTEAPTFLTRESCSYGRGFTRVDVFFDFGFGEGEVFSGSHITLFDEDGKCMTSISLSADGKTNSVDRYFYDSDGRLVSELRGEAPDLRYLYEDNVVVVAEVRGDSLPQVIERRTYDELRRLTQRLHLIPADRCYIESVEEFSY